jgi:hypothetical protein
MNKKNIRRTVKLVDTSKLAKEKGLRLKCVRNFANLTRQVIIDKYGKEFSLNAHTLQGWEVGRHGGLSRKGAKKIASLVALEGVRCSPEWLLYGVGSGPSIFEKFEEVSQLDEPINNGNFSQADERSHIYDELEFFMKMNKNVEYLFVEDDAMEPFYCRGELVAGGSYQARDIEKCIGKDCIVKKKDGQCLLRQLRKSDQKDRYNLLGINSDASIKSIVSYDVEVISVAPVLWIRKSLTTDQG